MVCSQIIKCAVEGKDLQQCFATRGLFYERTRLHLVTMKIKANEAIHVTVVRSVGSIECNDFCYYFDKLAISEN